MTPRILAEQVNILKAYFPIVAITGPRQSGKTTLLKNLFPELPYFTLEDPDNRLFAETDPRGFLANLPQGGILDEAQNVPILFSYLQGIVDETPDRQFFLSGSQNFLMMERITQSLAGRVGLLTLLPFSQSERQNYGDYDLNEWLWRGGYPALFDRKTPNERFFPNYLQTYLQKDVRLLKSVGDLSAFTRFVRLCAGRAGQLLNLVALANDADIAVNTAKAWLSVLEASNIVFRLPPYHVNFGKRLIKMPKIYFTDTGLLCYLLGIQSTDQLATHYMYGAIFENAIVLELFKMKLNVGQMPNFFFWQDSNANEIDVLMEAADGTLTPIEIKSKRTPTPDLFKNIGKWNVLSGNLASNSFIVFGGDKSQIRSEGRFVSWKEMTQDLAFLIRKESNT